MKKQQIFLWVVKVVGILISNENGFQAFLTLFECSFNKLVVLFLEHVVKLCWFWSVTDLIVALEGHFFHAFEFSDFAFVEETDFWEEFIVFNWIALFFEPGHQSGQKLFRKQIILELPADLFQVASLDERNRQKGHFLIQISFDLPDNLSKPAVILKVGFFLIERDSFIDKKLMPIIGDILVNFELNLC